MPALQSFFSPEDYFELALESETSDEEDTPGAQQETFTRALDTGKPNLPCGCASIGLLGTHTIRLLCGRQTTEVCAKERARRIACAKKKFFTKRAVNIQNLHHP